MKYRYAIQCNIEVLYFAVMQLTNYTFVLINWHSAVFMVIIGPPLICPSSKQTIFKWSYVVVSPSTLFSCWLDAGFLWVWCGHTNLRVNVNIYLDWKSGQLKTATPQKSLTVYAGNGLTPEPLGVAGQTSAVWTALSSENLTINIHLNSTWSCFGSADMAIENNYILLRDQIWH